MIVGCAVTFCGYPQEISVQPAVIIFIVYHSNCIDAGRQMIELHGKHSLAGRYHGASYRIFVIAGKIAGIVIQRHSTHALIVFYIPHGNAQAALCQALKRQPEQYADQ